MIEFAGFSGQHGDMRGSVNSHMGAAFQYSEVFSKVKTLRHDITPEIRADASGGAVGNTATFDYGDEGEISNFVAFNQGRLVAAAANFDIYVCGTDVCAKTFILQHCAGTTAIH